MEEEQYIDLKDIEILDEELDEDYNPSDEEIFAYAEYLGFDLENDQELLIIAYQALKTPLPPNWKRAIIKNSQEVLYINLEDQTLHTYSPIDEAAIIHYREQKEMLCKQAKSGSESNNNNKVIPRAKNLPPIEKGEGKNNKKDKFSLGSNFPKETKEEQQHQNILNENKKENETESNRHLKHMDEKDLNNLENVLNDNNKRKKRKKEKNLNENPFNNFDNNNVNYEPNKSKNDNDLDYIHGNLDIGKYNMKFGMQKNGDLNNLTNLEKQNLKDLKLENDQEQLIDNANSLFYSYEYRDEKSTIKSDNDKKLRRSRREKELEEEIEKQFAKQNNSNTSKKIKEDYPESSNIDSNDDENLLNDSFKKIKSNKKLIFDSNSNNDCEKIHSNEIVCKNSFKKEEVKIIDENSRKKEYLEIKIIELKRYENNLNKNYETQKKTFKSKRRKLQEEYQNNLELKLQTYKEEKEKELQIIIKMEEDKNDIKKKEKLKEAGKSLNLSIMSKADLSNEILKLENILSESEIVKNNLISELESYYKISKNINKTKKKDNPELKLAINLINEKLCLEKNNIERHIENKLKDIKLEQEKRLFEELEIYKAKKLRNKENLENQLKQYNIKIFDQFRGVVEEDKNTRIEEIKIKEKKNYNDKLKDLEKDNENIMNQNIIKYKNDHIKFEKSYFEDLKNLRMFKIEDKNISNYAHDLDNLKYDVDDRIKHKFETIINSYEQLKNSIKEKLGDYLANLVKDSKNKNENDISKMDKDNINILNECSSDNLKSNKFSNINYINFNNSNVSYKKENDLINKQNNNNDKDSEIENENKLDEKIMNLLDISTTEYLRKKNQLQNSELEKKEKLKIYDYYINLSSYAIKIMTDNCIKKINLDKISKIEINQTNLENNFKSIIMKSRCIITECDSKYINTKKIDFNFNFGCSINFNFDNLEIKEKIQNILLYSIEPNKLQELNNSINGNNVSAIIGHKKILFQNENDEYFSGDYFNQLKNHNNINYGKMLNSKKINFELPDERGFHNILNQTFDLNGFHFSDLKEINKNNFSLLNSYSGNDLRCLNNFLKDNGRISDKSKIYSQSISNDIRRSQEVNVRYMNFKNEKSLEKHNYSQNLIDNKKYDQKDHIQSNAIENINLSIKELSDISEIKISENISLFDEFINQENFRINSLSKQLQAENIVFENLLNAIKCKINHNNNNNDSLTFFEISNYGDQSKINKKYFDIIKEERSKIKIKQNFQTNITNLFKQIYDLIIEFKRKIKEKNRLNNNQFEEGLMKKICNIKKQILEYQRFFTLKPINCSTVSKEKGEVRDENYISITKNNSIEYPKKGYTEYEKFYKNQKHGINLSNYT